MRTTAASLSRNAKPPGGRRRENGEPRQHGARWRALPVAANDRRSPNPRRRSPWQKQAPAKNPAVRPHQRTRRRQATPRHRKGHARCCGGRRRAARSAESSAARSAARSMASSAARNTSASSQAARRAGQAAGMGRAQGAQGLHRLRGPRRRRQGRHHQGDHRARQPAGVPRRRAARADRAREVADVCAALPAAPAGRRRDRDLRPQLVQPRGRRARDGLLHRGAGAAVS